MNPYMRNYILACTSYLLTAKQSLRAAAIENDGTIDRREEKTLQKFNELTDRYIKAIQKLK